MIEIEKITANDLIKMEIIREIAQETWPVTYGEILSQDQIKYMFDIMYSTNSLLEQAAKKNLQFILVKEGNRYTGFASYEYNYPEIRQTKIHKIYILPSEQGKGIGRIIIDFVAKEAKNNDNTILTLNVNRYNQAQYFYKKIGFSITKEEVIAIGNDFVMDDYVMEKSI
jgi:GNAT superfamily N-acetyltransferase